MLGATLFVGCYSRHWGLLSSDFAAELASLAVGPWARALGPGTRDPGPIFEITLLLGVCVQCWVLPCSLGATLFVGCYSVRWVLLSSDFAAELASLAVGPWALGLGPGTPAPFLLSLFCWVCVFNVRVTLFVGFFFLQVS